MFYCIFYPGLAPQAQAHSETARTIMLNGLHTSESDESKSQLMGTLLLMYYVLGRALTILKKYPLLPLECILIFFLFYSF